MPSKNKKKPTLDLTGLIEGLSQAEIDFIIVGGVAAVAHGAPVTTFDLDIVHRQSNVNIEKLYGYLQTVDAHFRRPDEKILKPTIEHLKGRDHLLLSTTLGPLDVLTHVELDQGFDDLISDSVLIDFKGVGVWILSLEKLIELKRVSASPEDRYRLHVLEETHRLKHRKNEQVNTND